MRVLSPKQKQIRSPEYLAKHREREKARYWEKHKNDSKECVVCKKTYLKINRRGTTKTCSEQCSALLKKITDARIIRTQKAKERQAKYRQINKKHKAEYARAYRKTAAGKIAQAKADKKRNPTVKHSGYVARRYFRPHLDFSSGCTACGAITDLTIDHITPLSAGGKNCIENITILCRSCNSAKGNRHIISASMASEMRGAA